jgi:hypothetical protein
VALGEVLDDRGAAGDVAAVVEDRVPQQDGVTHPQAPPAKAATRHSVTARKHGVVSWGSYHLLRDQLLAEGKLAEAAGDGLLVFTEDTCSISPALCVGRARCLAPH